MITEDFMFSHRRTVFTLILISLLLLTASHASRAQETSEVNQQIESDEELLRKVELLTSKKFVRDRSTVTIRAERQLKKFLELYPNTFLRDRVEENLFQVQELLGEHHLQIAYFYYNRRCGKMLGARSRLRHITENYPKFSRMDEVLLLLGKVYLISDEPEDAANYFWELILKYPNSKYINEAFEQFGKVGFNAQDGCDNTKP